jgi:SAM-dependent methyltransferase
MRNLIISASRGIADELFPRFTNRRRALQLGRYAVRHGVRVLEKFNKTNIFLAKQFSNMEIYCNVCGARGKLWFEMHSVKEKKEHNVDLLRETLECLNCLSRMRYRVMAHALLIECRRRFGTGASSIIDLVGQIEKIDILDTDAFSPAARILERNKAYRISSYVPGRPYGWMADKCMFNLNLEDIAFPDASFHFILSSDVMEHVRNLERANNEIYRCLKPGGTHIFTVPFDEQALSTKTLIDTSSAEDIYLEPPQFHGDDHLLGKIPAYRVYGMDLLDDLRASGFEAALVKVKDRQSGIFNGAFFVARRPP